MTHRPYSLMLHGGALTPSTPLRTEALAARLDSLHAILEQGREILVRGGSALRAVEYCACRLEDDPLFNAGRGSVLNADGAIEMDAAIMDGRDLAAGAVAAIRRIANPVALARQVMRHSGHVLLAGAGAARYARQQGIPRVAAAALVTAARLQQYRSADPGDGSESPTGTIGAVACDKRGNLAAATSTGGVARKRAGRIGDSALVGAGVYADNLSCAVSATGRGEDFIRTVLAKYIADRIELLGEDAARAAQAGIEQLQRRVAGHGGVIVIDANGRCASRFTPGGMLHGWIEHGGPARCSWNGVPPCGVPRADATGGIGR
ncbi:MAG: isoaspartyl peptidase/L-asparaginase family protein [Pseudomonadota bacterium]